MDIIVEDYRAAVARLRQRLLKVAHDHALEFDTISIVTTGGLLLFDVGGNFDVLPIPKNFFVP